MHKLIYRSLIVALLAWMLAGCSKQDDFPPRDNTEEVKEFYKSHNALVKEEIGRDLAKVQKELASEKLSDEEKTEKTLKLKELLKRQKHPEVFTFSSLDALPQDLVWQTNWDEPEIGSEKAKKGGVFHYYFEGLTYPSTLRIIGPNSNNMFRGEHWDNIEMGLVGLHPNTGALIPALADKWAVSKDKRTVYFHIDDKATYNDGVPVESDDFFMAFYMRLGPYVNTPFGKQYFHDQFWNITRYDAKTLSITLNKAKPLTPYFANLVPYPRHFYKEVGPDFESRYNWRPHLTTGGYVIKSEDVVKGRSITLSRVKNWWAKDRKYSKNTCNVDKIVYRLIRDAEKALEYFKRGKIDFISLLKPKNWYEKTEIDAVFNGYIEKATFYNDYPAVPMGLYINCSRPLLNNRDIRIGLQYATNFDKVIKIDSRGDAVRCETFADGYGRYTNHKIKARRYSVEKAIKQFAKAGFTKRDDQGILMNDQGQKLSFTITCSNSSSTTALMVRLKEEALKAGVEYKIEGLDGSASFLKGLEKKHELHFVGWGVDLPFPSYRQIFHSDNAYEKGTHTPRPMTNNFSVYANPEMDKLSQALRDATSLDEIESLAHRIEEIIHRDAPWIPGYYTPFLRCAYWRWVRWPDDFNVKHTRDLYATHLFWIDEEVKKETLKAMHEGKTFPEKNLIFDQYRKKKASSAESSQSSKPAQKSAKKPAGKTTSTQAHRGRR